MKIEKMRVEDYGMIICVLALEVSTFIYPLLLSANAWIITEVLCIGVIVGLILLRGRFNIPKEWSCWLLTLFPLLFRSVSIESKEYGFTFIWITLMILMLSTSYCSKWVKYGVQLIGILTCIYAVSTVLVNLGGANILIEQIAAFYRGEIEIGTLATAGLTSHYSHNGMYIAVGCVIWYAKTLESRDVKHFLILGMFLVALLFTQKRGPLIAIVMAMIITYYVAQRGDLNTRLERLLVIIFVVVCAVYIMYIFMPSAFAVFERFSTDDGILTNRQYLWEYALECFDKSPIIGNGWGYYPHSLGLKIDTVTVINMNAHNIYLQLLAETGIVGFVCFMIPILLTFIKSIKLVKRWKGNMIPIYYAVGMQAFFLIYGLSGNPLYDKQIIIPYMIAVAIVLNYNQNILKHQRGITK